MPVIQPKLHQKKKPTRQAKRKSIIVDKVDPSNTESITNDDPLHADIQDDTDDPIIIPVRLFDDAINPIVSPPILKVGLSFNNGYTKHKHQLSKNHLPY